MSYHQSNLIDIDTSKYNKKKQHNFYQNAFKPVVYNASRTQIPLKSK